MDTRLLALALLVDSLGINAKAWAILRAELIAMGDNDILALVQREGNRHHIPPILAKNLPEYV